MPGFDGTGPMGQGALTGGGRGRCGAGQQQVAQGGMGNQGGAGYGRGRGARRGRRNRFQALQAEPSQVGVGYEGESVSAQEVDALRAELAGAKEAVAQLSERIERMQASPAEEADA